MDTILAPLVFAFILLLFGGVFAWFRYDDTRAHRALTSKNPAPLRDLDENMVASFEIRPMVQRDYEAIRALELMCFEWTFVNDDCTEHEWLTQEGEPHVTYVATVEGKVVGYTHLELTQPVLYLGLLGVARSFRSHGVGARLAKYVVEVVAPSLGCTHVRLTVRRHNFRAARLYRSLGFEYVRDINGMHEVKIACPVGIAVAMEG